MLKAVCGMALFQAPKHWSALGVCNAPRKNFLDGKSAGAVASADIEQYYDNIRPLRCISWLTNIGIHITIIHALLRIQCLPTIVFRVLNHGIKIANRTVGAITGTRGSGLLGRIPVADCVRESKIFLKENGFNFGGNRRLSLMSWVDNLYTFSLDPDRAVQMLDVVEAKLQSRWGLRFKPGSRMVLQPKGSQPCVLPNAKWSHVSMLPVLGHLVSDDGGLCNDWIAMKRKMWGAFWGNAGAKCVRGLDLMHKIRLIDRAVTSIASFRWSRWPPQKLLASHVDQIQCKMFFVVQNLRPKHNEDLIGWNVRRWKAAHKLVRSYGLWSHKWFNRAMKWHEHVCRHPELVIHPLLVWRGKDWLQERRQSLLPLFSRGFSSLSMLAGCTGTRCTAGAVHRRWHDGYDCAKESQIQTPPFLV